MDLKTDLKTDQLILNVDNDNQKQNKIILNYFLKNIKPTGILHGCYIVPKKSFEENQFGYKGIWMQVTNFIYKSLYLFGVLRVREVQRGKDNDEHRIFSGYHLVKFLPEDKWFLNGLIIPVNDIYFRFLPMKTWYSGYNDYLRLCYVDFPYVTSYIGLLFNFAVQINILPSLLKRQWKLFFVQLRPLYFLLAYIQEICIDKIIIICKDGGGKFKPVCGEGVDDIVSVTIHSFFSSIQFFVMDWQILEHFSLQYGFGNIIINWLFNKR